MAAHGHHRVLHVLVVLALQHELLRRAPGPQLRGSKMQLDVLGVHVPAEEDREQLALLVLPCHGHRPSQSATDLHGLTTSLALEIPERF